MEFYISPENLNKLNNKLNRMFKHLETAPKVNIGTVETIKKTVVTVADGGHEIKNYKIQAMHVEIEDIKTGDWKLVATVDWENGMLLEDRELFKMIPEGYGLDYMKCDYCGTTHKSRKEAHILYNEKEDKWMQVGSTCVNKMIAGAKYLNGLMINLYKVVKEFGGCDSDGFSNGGWTPSHKYMMEAVSFNEAIAKADFYRNNVSDVWKKAEKGEGTNTELINFISPVKTNDELYNTLKNYFDTKEYGVIPEYGEKSLTQKIKDAFADEYICAKEMYLAWFAIQMYKSSLERPEYEKKLEELGIVKDTEFNFVGKVKNVESYEVTDYYTGRDTLEFMFTLVDDNTGIEFVKTVSNPDAVNKYQDENGVLTFTGKIKYIDTFKQLVTFGGRLKKTAKPKKK